MTSRISKECKEVVVGNDLISALYASQDTDRIYLGQDTCTDHMVKFVDLPSINEYVPFEAPFKQYKTNHGLEYKGPRKQLLWEIMKFLLSYNNQHFFSNDTTKLQLLSDEENYLKVKGKKTIIDITYDKLTIFDPDAISFPYLYDNVEYREESVYDVFTFKLLKNYGMYDILYNDDMEEEKFAYRMNFFVSAYEPYRTKYVVKNHRKIFDVVVESQMSGDDVDHPENTSTFVRFELEDFLREVSPDVEWQKVTFQEREVRDESTIREYNPDPGDVVFYNNLSLREVMNMAPMDDRLVRLSHDIGLADSEQGHI